MMNKIRIESLSDGLFSIVMTLLVLDIKVPHLLEPKSGGELVCRLLDLWPLFRSYYITFAILGMYWLSHHVLFHLIAKHANRILTYLNILFLVFVALVPFSAHLIGQYPCNEIAVAVYGANVITIGLVQYGMLLVTLNDARIQHEQISIRLVRQMKLRMLLPPVFAVFGILISPFSPAISFILFAIPVVLNIVPGALTLIEFVIISIPHRRGN